MGTETMTLSGPGTFYIENPETGEMQEFAPFIGGKAEVYIPPLVEVLPNPAKIAESIQITGEIIIPWYVMLYGKLSRKRFVKLLMSKGISRNKANSLARSWREKTRGAPYYLEALACGFLWGRKQRFIHFAPK